MRIHNLLHSFSDAVCFAAVGLKVFVEPIWENKPAVTPSRIILFSIVTGLLF